MNLTRQVALAIGLSVAAVAAFAAVVLRVELHRDLGQFSRNFAMMRSMMGWGPDLERIYLLVDRVLLQVLLVAVFVGIVAGAVIGRRVLHPVASIKRGLQRFASRDFSTPIDDRGPSDTSRVARTRWPQSLRRRKRLSVT
jgi:HAMP domain-containing protein